MHASFCRRLSFALVIATAGLLVTPARADQILQIYNDTLTTYKSAGSISPYQFVRPIAIQRGVEIDGSARAAAGHSWAFAGNPFGDAVPTATRVGDINLTTGAYSPTDVDIALPAPGASRVVIGRTFNGRQTTAVPAHTNSEGYQGINWFQMGNPELKYYTDADTSKNVIYLIYGADRYIEFKRTGESTDYYQARNGAAGVIQRVQQDTGEEDLDPEDDIDYFIYYDQHGTRTYFIGSLNTGTPAWQLWKVVDAAGNTTYVGDASDLSSAITNGYTGFSSRPSVLVDGADRRFTYTYSASAIGFSKRLTRVKVETKTGGTWFSSPTGVATVAQVDYEYYTSITAASGKGLEGDLKLVTVTTPMTDSGVNMVETKYFRYYTAAYSNSDGLRGEPHMVKLVVGREGYRKFEGSDGNFGDDDISGASDSDLKPYAEAWMEYTDSGGSFPYRVSKAFFSGECGCSGGANGAYEFTYEDNGAFSGSAGYDTAWKSRVVVKQPDGTYRTVYFDEVGQSLSHVVTNTDPAGDPGPTKTWVTGVVRDSAGCVTEVHTPANVTGYTHNSGGPPATPDGAITYSSSVGLVNLFERDSGDTTGFPKSQMFKEGTSGTAKYLSFTVYGDRDFQVTSGVNVTRPVITTRRVFHTAHTASGADTTYNDDATMSHAWWSATNTDVLYITLKQITTTNPVVTTGNNGSNAATVSERYLREDGTTAFTMDPLGIFDFTAFTNGQLTKHVRDAVTTGAFTGDDPNGRWGITENGNGSDRTTLYSYDAQARPSTTTLPSGRVTENYYTAFDDDRRVVTLSWPRMTTGGSTTRYGPASYSVANHAGKSEMSGVVAISSSGLTDALTTWIDETDNDPITGLDKGTLTSMRTAVYTNTGHQATEERTYFLLPGSGAGSEGTNYDATRLGYDDMGRQRRVKQGHGTITRTVFDELGRAYQTYLGTNDNGDAGGEVSGTNNMVKVSELEFDSGSAGGNSLATKSTAFIQDNTTGRRDTTYAYDFRGRALLTTNPQAPHTLVKVDNLDRVTGAAQYTSTGSITVGTTDPGASGTQSDRVALSKTFYDQLGRVWKTTRYKIDQSDGSDDDSIDSLTWHDPSGRVMKVKGEGAHEKYRYDRLGRRVQTFILATDDDTQYGHASATTAVWDSDDLRTNLASDIVLEEHQTAYESEDSDNVLMTVSIRRHYDDLSNGTTGELDLNADGGSAGTGALLTLTAIDVKGRVSVTAMWYDSMDRIVESVRYGTNAIVGDRSSSSNTFTRGGLGVPARLDTALRTTVTYGDDGTTLEVEDPRAVKTRFEYDALFRQTKVIGNYADGTPGGGGNGDQDQTVVYEYSKGLRTKIKADLPSPATDQVTTYIFGSTKATPSAMKIATGHLLRAVKYPDSGNGGTTVANIDSDSSDVVSHAYNAQGEMTYTKDQAGNIVETDFDTAGRETQRRVTTLAGGYDGNVRRIARAYLSRGLANTVTQYSDEDVGEGTVRDQLQYAYDGWGNLTTFTQDPDSVISGGTDRDAYAISYTFAKVTPTNARTVVRRTAASYPGGSDLSYQYQSHSNHLGSAAHRVTSVVSNAVALAEYQFVGLGTLVSTDLVQCNAINQHITGVGAYGNLDRFDRVVTNIWEGSSSAVSRTGAANIYNVALTYDRNSNITSATDTLRVNGSSQRNFDVLYGLDNLNRLISAEEGTLSGTVSNRSRNEVWTLDQAGNWLTHNVDFNGDNDYLDNVPPQEFQETRTHNVVNELTDRDQDTNATVGFENAYNLSYNAVGGLSDDGKNYTYVYDAFGRLCQVLTRGGSPALVIEYRYNGLGYRIGDHYDVDADTDVDSNDEWYYHQYDERWRIIATYFHDPSTAGTDDDAPKARQVYHAAGIGGRNGSGYIDAVILRDKDANTAWEAASDGTLEERRYYCQNWRADVSALLTDVGKLVESVKYRSYGVPYGLPTGDTDSDGDWDTTDAGLIGGGGYVIQEDADLDGDNDAADATFASSITGGYQTLGHGTLSSAAVENLKAYAGYSADFVLVSIFQARTRWFMPDRGGWLQRDRYGYVDGMSLYEYVSSMPLKHSDPSGGWSQIMTDLASHTFPPSSTTSTRATAFFWLRLCDMIELSCPEGRGYVVGHVRWQGKIRDCAGRTLVNGDGTPDYWEMFRVPRTRPIAPAVSRLGTPPLDSYGNADESMIGWPGPCRTGTPNAMSKISSYAEFRLYCPWETLFESPENWIPGTNHVPPLPSKALPSVQRRPSWWEPPTQFPCYGLGCRSHEVNGWGCGGNNFAMSTAWSGLQGGSTIIIP
ncbi:MAG: hypothetical protein WD749_02800 [Phycisphaerales bacterium]